MLFDDTYLTIEKPAEAIFRDRGSKFLALAMPVKNEGELKEVITRLKAEHPKANHHCWALRLTPDRSVFRVNDDGEPSGTAGRPILNALLSRNVTNTAIVVTRYFGGTLLGVPGLINAYKTAAEDVLKQATIVERTINDLYSIEFDFLQMNDVMKIIKDSDLKITEQAFDTKCIVQLSIRQGQVNAAVARLSKVETAVLKYLYTG